MTTRWRPDTCGCEIDYDWDAAHVNLIAVAAKPCALHGGTPQQILDTVLSENRGKNLVLKEAMKVNPNLTPDDYHYSFDANRKLVVDFGGKLTSEEIASVVLAAKVTNIVE